MMTIKGGLLPLIVIGDHDPRIRESRKKNAGINGMAMAIQQKASKRNAENWGPGG